MPGHTQFQVPENQRQAKHTGEIGSIDETGQIWPWWLHGRTEGSRAGAQGESLIPGTSWSSHVRTILVAPSTTGDIPLQKTNVVSLTHCKSAEHLGCGAEMAREQSMLHWDLLFQTQARLHQPEE